MQLLHYFHTGRYLKPVQVYGRLWYWLYRPVADEGLRPDLRPANGVCRAGARHPARMRSCREFELLNEVHEVQSASDWDNPSWDKLWRYNLHYFDNLTAEDAGVRVAWPKDLIARWIRENPPGRGTGWEPYPLSRRVVNWIKWWQAWGAECPDPPLVHADAQRFLDSLAVQVRFLCKRIEYHLLGNHLLSNAKALVFAGLFFEGKEAEGWLDKGLRLLEREIPEQILPDGGHFERSVMYHAIVLEDLLDLINLAQTYESAFPRRHIPLVAQWRDTANRMRGWLAAMLHPDGEIALFNDAAFRIAALPAELDAYSRRLGLHEPPSCTPGLIHLKDSGYIRWQDDAVVAFLDVGEIGPDYLPGHAHADTLSFELSLHGQRLIVDSGTSCYGTSAERLRQRGTAAHNTVSIDGADSSEVWGGFRVARRARPRGLEIREREGHLAVSCGHDGFRRLRGSPIHRRRWELSANEIGVFDAIEGTWQGAVARYHFHPEIRVDGANSSGTLALPGGQLARWAVLTGQARVVNTTYHPEFGISHANRCLEVAFTGPESAVRFFWQ